MASPMHSYGVQHNAWNPVHWARDCLAEYYHRPLYYFSGFANFSGSSHPVNANLIICPALDICLAFHALEGANGRNRSMQLLTGFHGC